jgi:hypothetical protein
MARRHRAIHYKSSVCEAHTSGLFVPLPAEVATQAGIPCPNSSSLKCRPHISKLKPKVIVYCFNLSLF